MTPPNSITADALDRELAALTAAPEAGGAVIWQAALERTGSPRSLRSLLSHPLPLAASGAILGVFVLAVLVSIPLTASVGARRSVGSAQPRELSVSRAPSSPLPAKPPMFAADAEGSYLMAGLPNRRRDEQPEPAAAQPPSPDRHVIRKAQIDLRTEESLRVIFLKAQQVISEARGEYIENASLTGEGKDGERTIATLTLRIAADRLSAVLGQLRELGVVASESTTGEDVTDRVVDLEARLRNEQRIEAELLELLASRQDASLNEILQLRTQVSSVREGIERLIAQRDRLGRLVALATILVTIQPVDAKDKEPEAPTLAGYFADSIQAAWTSSLRFLIDTAALLVRIAVGGLVWWVLLLVGVLAVRAGLRKRARAAAMEPAPSL